MMLSIKNFKKQYPGNPEPVLVIKELITEQGIYWLKGENGSGKTSLFKSLAGLIPFEGEISVNGIDIIKQRMEYTRLVNYAEAEPLFPAFLTGKDLIDFYISTKGTNFPTALFNSLGVDKFMRQKTAVYSSGMMKKLSLLLAFIGSPVLVLLDEPLIALDTASVQILEELILQKSREGISFLITSHQPLSQLLMDVTTTLLLQNKTLVKAVV